MDDTAASMARITPFLWDLLDTLLLTRGKTTNLNVAASEGPEGEPGGDDEDNWEHMNFPEDSDELEQVILNVTPGDRDHNMKKHQQEQKSAIIEIVSLTYMRPHFNRT